MIKSIHSFDDHNEYFNIDITTISGLDKNEIRWGWFKRIDSVLTALFSIEKDFYFLKDKRCIKITENTTAAFYEINEQDQLFKLFDSGKVLLEFRYIVDKTLFNISPFEYLDEEDFDWGMFLRNVINDKERQKRILNNLATSDK